MPTFSFPQLVEIATRILRGGGASETEADIVSQELAQANLTGHDSHGIIRLKQYVDYIHQGYIRPGGAVKVVARYPGIAIVDGGRNFGQVVARRALEGVPDYFSLQSFRVMDERRWNVRGELVTLSEAVIKVDVGDDHYKTVAEGNGPVNALDNALREALSAVYPQLEDMRLTDYKVRILTPGAGTEAITRVVIESVDSKGNRWSTMGVSENVIDASFNALHDAITYKLYRDGAEAK